MFKYLINFLIFTSYVLFAKEEIVVSLKTQNKLFPVTVCKIGEERYLEELIKILKFDLSNNGYTYTSNISDINITLKLKNEVLSIFFKNNNLFSKFKIKRDLKEDRKRIHKLADDLLYSLFGKKGIATTKILYSFRYKNPKYKSLKHKKYLSEIWICDYDGKNKKRLTFENNYIVNPIFMKKSYKNLEFLAVSYKGGIPKIYLFQKGNSKPFVSLRGNQLLPSISKNLDGVAFISDVAGRADLFYQRLRNKKPFEKPRQLFSYPRATQASSSFSPNGKNLAFVSDKSGSPRIYILKILENKNNRRPKVELITIKNRENVNPSWSLDGKKIAYSAKTDGIRQIWIYDFIEKREEQLTFGRGNKENPSWAGDNLHIVYNTEDEIKSEMYIIDLNRRKPIKIGNGRFPNWENKGRL